MWGRTRGLSWEWDPLPVRTGRVCTSGIEPEIAQTNYQQGNGPRASARTKKQPICLWPPPTSIPWVTCKGTGLHYQELHPQLEEDIWWELGEWQGQGCPTTTKEMADQGHYLSCHGTGFLLFLCLPKSSDSHVAPISPEPNREGNSRHWNSSFTPKLWFLAIFSSLNKYSA